jgi:hypothetical protein
MRFRLFAVAFLMLVGSSARAQGTGAITLVNKTDDTALTMYAGDSDHSCNANPGEQCTIELQPGEYNVLIVHIGTSDEVAKTTVTVEEDKENVLTITDN